MKLIEEGKISGSQLMWMLVTIVLPTAVLFIPALTIRLAGSAAWISGAVIATSWGIFVVWIAATLGERFPGMTLADYSGQILGKFGGKIIGAFYIFILLHANALITREFGEFLVTAFMPETPIEVFNFFLLALAASAVRNGVEVIARMNHFVVALMFLSLLFIFSLVFGDMDFRHLLPIFGEGIGPIMESSLIPMGWRGQTVLILFFMPYLNNYREARYAGYKAVLMLGFILAVDIIIALGVFGRQAANFVFPAHSMATYISVAGFVERVEAFILALWVAGITMKVSLWYYCLTVLTARTLNLQDYKPVVLPLGVIILVWSITAADNIRELVKWINETGPFYFMAWEVIVPALLLVTAVLRKKGGQQSGR